MTRLILLYLLAFFALSACSNDDENARRDPIQSSDVSREDVASGGADSGDDIAEDVDSRDATPLPEDVFDPSEDVALEDTADAVEDTADSSAQPDIAEPAA